MLRRPPAASSTPVPAVPSRAPPPPPEPPARKTRRGTRGCRRWASWVSAWSRGSENDWIVWSRIEVSDRPIGASSAARRPGTPRAPGRCCGEAVEAVGAHGRRDARAWAVQRGDDPDAVGAHPVPGSVRVWRLDRRAADDRVERVERRQIPLPAEQGLDSRAGPGSPGGRPLTAARLPARNCRGRLRPGRSRWRRCRGPRCCRGSRRTGWPGRQTAGGTGPRRRRPRGCR